MFACTGLALEDLSRVTAVAVEAGYIVTNSNGVRRIIRFPPVCGRNCRTIFNARAAIVGRYLLPILEGPSTDQR